MTAEHPHADDEIGGWIGDFLPELPPCEWDVNSEYHTNLKRYEYFTKYKQIYFNDTFIFGWGTEDILTMLNRYIPSNSRWLDIGCGTETLLWSVAIDSPKVIGCVDIVPEALIVLNEFKSSNALPACYIEAAKYLQIHRSRFQRNRQSHWRYFLFDTFVKWPRFVPPESWDAISAIGNFGLSKTPAKYITSVQNSTQCLAPGGVIVGADWVRSPYFVSREQHDNRYINEDIVREAVQLAGLTIIDLKRVTIDGDPLYDAVICWAACKQISRRP